MCGKVLCVCVANERVLPPSWYFICNALKFAFYRFMKEIHQIITYNYTIYPISSSPFCGKMQVFTVVSQMGINILYKMFVLQIAVTLKLFLMVKN